MPSRLISFPIVGIVFWLLLIAFLLLFSVSCVIGVAVCTVQLRPYTTTQLQKYVEPKDEPLFLPILPRHVRYLERAKADHLHLHAFSSSVFGNQHYMFIQ